MSTKKKLRLTARQKRKFISMIVAGVLAVGAFGFSEFNHRSGAYDPVVSSEQGDAVQGDGPSSSSSNKGRKANGYID